MPYLTTLNAAASVAGVSLVPALIAAWSPPPGADARTLAKWQGCIRSLVHCLGVLCMVATVDDLALPLFFMHAYMWVDSAAAYWEVGGDRTPSNWVHHGLSLVLTGFPLASDHYLGVAHAVAKPFLLSEASTVFLNAYHILGLSAHTRACRRRAWAWALFVAAFMATRPAYMTWHVWGLWADGTLGSMSLALRWAVLGLLGLQWVWAVFILKKSGEGKRRRQL